MGLKSSARRLASEAGAPVAPGYDGEDQNVETLRSQIIKIEFPVLIKASAGGGGKGMRVVRDESAVDEALESARREAEKAFGDGSLLLEKYVEGARHIEIQILGDCMAIWFTFSSGIVRYNAVIRRSSKKALHLRSMTNYGERWAPPLSTLGARSVTRMRARLNLFFLLPESSTLSKSTPACRSNIPSPR